MKLEEMTNKELTRICKDKGIPAGKLRNKKELIAAIETHTAEKGEETPVVAPVAGEGVEKPKVYLGKCAKTGEKLYK